MAKKKPERDFDAVFAILFLLWDFTTSYILKLWQKLDNPVQTATF